MSEVVAPSPSSARSDRPRVFISSTIHDFRDLRSALKYWLEGLDLQVMLSEVNDFAKSGDDNSYEACLKAIERCDYFVLLVGARVGGLYDSAKKISITRMEYRRAYDCLQKGTLKIFAFVRNEIWIIREDRKALERLLQEDQALTTEKSRDAILNHGSRIINDAAATFSFLDEIRRSEEMKHAILSGTGFPKGNWIHPFETFADIAGALEQGLNLTGNRRKRGLSVGLMRELQVNMQTLLSKHERNVVLDERVALFTARSLRISKRFDESSVLELQEVNTLLVALLGAGGTQRSMQTRFLDEALRTGEFLEYDSGTNEYGVGPIQKSLLDLGSAMESFRNAPPTEDARRKLFDKYVRKGDRTAPVSVMNGELVGIYMYFLKYDALVRAMLSTYRILIGIPPLNTFDEKGRLREAMDVPLHEKPSLDEVDAWMRTHKPED